MHWNLFIGMRDPNVQRLPICAWVAHIAPSAWYHGCSPAVNAGANDPSAQLVPVDAALPESMRCWTAPPVDLAALYPALQQGMGAQGLVRTSADGGAELLAGSTAPQADAYAPAAAAAAEPGAAQGPGFSEPDTPPAAPPAALPLAQA
jgi:hypothetical protein